MFKGAKIIFLKINLDDFYHLINFLLKNRDALKHLDFFNRLSFFITQVCITTLFDVDELAERIAEANLSLPTPIVSVEEINLVNNSVIESESSF